MTSQADCLAGNGAKHPRRLLTLSVPPLKVLVPQVTRTALHPCDLVSLRWALWWHHTLLGSPSRLALSPFPLVTAQSLPSQEAKSVWIMIMFCATPVSHVYMY